MRGKKKGGRAGHRKPPQNGNTELTRLRRHRDGALRCRRATAERRRRSRQGATRREDGGAGTRTRQIQNARSRLFLSRLPRENERGGDCGGRGHQITANAAAEGRGRARRRSHRGTMMTADRRRQDPNRAFSARHCRAKKAGGWDANCRRARKMAALPP